ncbi:MAG TPA: hypothetical protein VF035_02890 [Longimicrobiales bacterium]
MLRLIEYQPLNTKRHFYRYDESGWMLMDSLNTSALRFPQRYYASGLLWTHNTTADEDQYRYDGLGRLIARRTAASNLDPLFYDGVNPGMDGTQDIIHEPGVDVPIFTSSCILLVAGGRFLTALPAGTRVQRREPVPLRKAGASISSGSRS